MSHDFLHRASWRAFRLGALIIGLPVAAVLVSAAALLWRLSTGPLDVTRIADHFAPVAIQAGSQPDHPAGRLAWDRVYLSWQPGLRHLHPLLIAEARNLRILRSDGTATASVRKAQIDVKMAPVLRGVIEPTRISVDQAEIILKRDRHGQIDLDWPDAVHRPSHDQNFVLEALQRIDIQQAKLLLRDAVPGRKQGDGDLTLTLEKAALQRSLPSDMTAWAGSLSGALGPATGPQAPFQATGRDMSEAFAWHVVFGPITPSLFGGLLPHAQAWHLPVSLEAQFQIPKTLSASLKSLPVSEGTISVDLGKGSIDQKDDQPLQVAQARLAASLNRNGKRAADGMEVSIDNAQAFITLIDDLGHTTRFAAEGDLSVDSLLHAKRIRSHVSATGTTLDVPHLSSIWPKRLMKGARRWVTRNMTDGIGTGLRLDARLQSEAGWEEIRPIQTDASLDVQGATVHWLRPVPPARQVSAHFSFAGPDILKIAFLGGTQPSSEEEDAPVLALRGGDMLIADLFEHDQIGTIHLDLSGDLAAHLGLLAHPRLHLLSRHPLPFTHPSGPVTVKGELSLPLSARIENDQIHVLTQAHFSNVSLGNVVLGRDLSKAEGNLTATEDGLKLSGSGLLDGVPTTATLQENFESREGGLREQVHAVAVVDEAALARSQLGKQSIFRGTAQLVADYKARFDGQAEVALSLDLADAAITIPVWRKAQGVGATASTRIGLDKGSITAIDQVRAEGPGLHVEGKGRITQGQVDSLVLNNFVVGRSNGDAVIDLPDTKGGPVTVTVHARDLDIAPLLKSDDATKGKKSGKPAQSDDKTASGPDMRWTVDIATDRLFYSQKGFFGGAVAHLEHRNHRLDAASFSTRSPVVVQAALIPQPDGRVFQLDVDNLGTLLTQTGMTARLEGGRARVSGYVGDGGTGSLPPFKGLVTVSPFAFRQPPSALTAAARLSIFNWSQASSERFKVQKLRLPVKIANDVMTIHEGELNNTALGATLEGRIGLDQGSLDLQGTVVPLFGLNAAPGRLPNVGKLFSPEEGGGVLAATFTVQGSASDPALSVNPFAMLLPGVMRQLAK
uniref:DUF3971 domain-containing protein n=1 Tax=Asaia astilbis TaxID=610244 RepID=UPI001E366F02|nr:DUF3971 domain-containing protein [Asaia astilbis]